MRTKLFSLMSSIIMLASAQSRDNLDILSFVPPEGWKMIKNDYSVTYEHTNPDKNSWCQLSVYQQIPSKGSIDADFASEWDELVAKQVTVTVAPITNPPYKKGEWTLIEGSGKASYSSNEMLIRLTTIQGNGVCMSVVARTNDTGYCRDVDAFIQSLEMKPDGEGIMNQLAGLPASSYAYTVSNFDDGWVSTVMQDYVLVQKESSSVYLNFTLPYNASQFSGTGLAARDYYWDQVVSKLFSVQSKYYNDGGTLVMKPEYVEGKAVDRQNGMPCYIGMYLLISTNAVSVVIGTAPDEMSYRKLFPRANDPFTSDLAAMTRYNKFAIASSDVLGKWQNGNTETAQWYYVSPSGYEGYAGMTLAATSATFIFKNDMTYTSIHNGATGSVGNMNSFQQEYSGKYSVANWAISATQRYQGNTDRFDAYFVAVRGGRILKLNNGAGQEYSLLKVKGGK